MAQILAQIGQPEPRNEEIKQPPNNHSMNGGNNMQFNPKIEFPTFDGNDPRGWIKKYTCYFTFCHIHDNQEVDLASLHLKRPSKVWFGSYIMGRRGVTWDEFIVDICSRFKDDLNGKVIEDFNRLQ